MNNIYRQYDERGLTDYKLTSLDDMKAIHGYDIHELKGFSDLTTENKELFSMFIINFFNAHGMERRSVLQPLQVNYVQHTEYARPTGEIDNEGKAIHELAITEIKRLTSSGKYEKYLRHTFCKDVCLANCKGYQSYFLRIDYKDGRRKEWLHVLSPHQWY